MIKEKVHFFYQNNKFILNNSFISLFLSGFGMLLLLAQNIIIARFFGDSNFGKFSYNIEYFFKIWNRKFFF